MEKRGGLIFPAVEAANGMLYRPAGELLNWKILATPAKSEKRECQWEGGKVAVSACVCWGGLEGVEAPVSVGR